MVPAENNAKHLLSVNHTTKIIHRHHHHHPCEVVLSIVFLSSVLILCFFSFDLLADILYTYLMAFSHFVGTGHLT